MSAGCWVRCQVCDEALSILDALEAEFRELASETRQCDPDWAFLPPGWTPERRSAGAPERRSASPSQARGSPRGAGPRSRASTPRRPSREVICGALGQLGWPWGAPDGGLEDAPEGPAAAGPGLA